MADKNVITGQKSVDLFAGIPVSDYKKSLKWYEKFFGCPPTFLPNDKEAVWYIRENRFIFIELKPEDAGHARHLLFVDNLKDVEGRIAKNGIKPHNSEKYSNGVSKINYKDPDGNEISFGAGGS